MCKTKVCRHTSFHIRVQPCLTVICAHSLLPLSEHFSQRSQDEVTTCCSTLGAHLTRQKEVMIIQSTHYTYFTVRTVTACPLFILLHVWNLHSFSPGETEHEPTEEEGSKRESDRACRHPGISAGRHCRLWRRGLVAKDLSSERGWWTTLHF